MEAPLYDEIKENKKEMSSLIAKKVALAVAAKNRLNGGKPGLRINIGQTKQ